MSEKRRFTFIDFMRNYSTFKEKDIKEYAKENKETIDAIDKTIAQMKRK